MADHYYTNQPGSVSEERIIHYESPSGELELVTDRGVFSGSRVDFGSDLLIRTVAGLEDEPASLLDIGCGYGPIGLSLGRLWKGCRLTLADVNERAMELCARNARALGLPASVVNNDTDPPAGRFELVLTNPPIRAGKKVIYALFEQAFDSLIPGGRLYVVIQKKQGADSAAEELRRLFGNCETVERDAGYHILRCVRRFRAAVFDLDGTLLDTLQDLAAAGNETLEAFGCPVHPTEAYRLFVGRGIPNLIRSSFPENISREITDRAYVYFKEYYAKHCMDRTVPYPGIPELLSSLRERGLRLAVVSNKDEALTRELMEHFFPGIFSAVKGRRDGVAVKPDPTLVFETLSELSLRPAEVLYLGDSNVDMQTAQNAGLASCGVLWGFRGREELLEAGADCLAASPEALSALFM